MNKVHFVLAFSAMAALAACNKNHDDDSNSAVNDLNHYVDSVKAVSENRSKENWVEQEAGYQARVARAEAAAKDEKEKAKLDSAKTEFEEHRISYQTDLKTKEVEVIVLERRRALRTNLFGEGKIGEDVRFDWVTAQNIRGVYDNFVDAVNKDKDNLSREDWDEIKVLYEALDTRKNEVEKEGLATKDNLHIAKRKVEFAAIETTKRPAAKARENAEAKE